MGSSYSYPTGPSSCEDITDPCPKIQSPSNAGLVVLYCSWAVIFCCLVVFYIRRMLIVRSKDFSGPARTSRCSSTERESEMVDVAERESGTTEHNMKDTLLDDSSIFDDTKSSSIVQIPFKTDVFGTVCYNLVNLVSISWVLILLVIIIDVYVNCQLHGIDSLCYYGSYPIFGDYDTNSEYLFTVWCLSSVWLLVVLVYKDQLRGWFMLPSTMTDATHMYIWTRDDVVQVTEEDTFLFVLWLRDLRMRLTPKHLRDGHETTVPVTRGPDNVKYFIHEATRYTYTLTVDAYMIPNMDVVGKKYSDFHKNRTGHSDTKGLQYLSKFGPNKIPFERRTIPKLLSDEMFTYFYYYQFVMYVVWFWFSYLFVATIEASVVLLGAVVSVYIQWNNEKTIASLTEYETTVTIKRDGKWVQMSSDLIVPGDIVKITETHWTLPCDMVLVCGSCILNESGLTGESMPVQKTACPNESEEYNVEGTGVRHTLFAGTTVLQLDTDRAGTVEAFVTRTGTGTSKGQLISTILYPEQLRFKYEEELEVVIALLLVYGIVAFALSCYLQDWNGSDSTWITKWAYGMFTVSQIFSPLLPVALKVGQIRSSYRLAEKEIYCINPRRIAISGKVTVFCFDKTGTLTKEGMEFSGVSVAETKNGVHTLSELKKDVHTDNSVPQQVIECMATCHAVAKYGEDQFVGNEVEVKMFASSGWVMDSGQHEDHVLVSSKDGSQSMKVLRKYEFDHARQTMSVIAEDTHGVRHVFCKGSFEKIEALCDPEGVPDGYSTTARHHAINGGYVLGFAHRLLKVESNSCRPVDGDVVDSADEQRADEIGTAVDSIPRDDIESPHAFKLLGLMIFRNEPKDDSRDAILQLRDGVVRPVMITGDNAQCGQYISRSCGLVDDSSRILLGETCKSTAKIIWTFIGDEDGRSYNSVEVLSLINDKNSVEDADGFIELAVTGNNTIESLEKDGILDTLLVHIRIFARTSPDSKSMIIRKFRKLGYIVGMCGDGGNDCGALRAAHAGIALSEAEASVVSPFTSHTKSPLSVVDLLREGRASLATSFANYKFLIMYGLLFSIIKLCSFYYGVIMSSMSYYCIDGIAITSLCYTMTLSEPVVRLSKKRPSASLLGPSTVLSCLGVASLSFICLLSALFMMKNNPDYVKWPAEYSSSSDWWTISDNWEGTVLYAVMYLFLLSSAGIFSFGYKFRLPVHSNITLVANIAMLYIITTLILLMEPNEFSDMWHIASYQFNSKNSVSPVWEAYQADGGSTSPAMSFGFRIKLYILVSSFIAMSICWQAFVMEGFIGDYMREKYPIVKRLPIRL